MSPTKKQAQISKQKLPMNRPRYIVLKGPITQLVRDINWHIESGYKPTGGPFVIKKAATYTRYGQAMWLPEPEE